MSKTTDNDSMNEYVNNNEADARANINVNKAAADDIGAADATGAADVADAGRLPSSTAKDAAAAAAVQGDVEQDRIFIADEVITQIVLIAVGRVSGISLPSAGVGDGIAGLLGMKGSTRGIRVETDEHSVGVDISISVEYGIKISDIAKMLQDEIRKDLSDMTGFDVTHVNVHVTSVNTKEPQVAKSQKASKTQQKEANPDESATDDAKPQAQTQDTTARAQEAVAANATTRAQEAVAATTSARAQEPPGQVQTQAPAQASEQNL